MLNQSLVWNDILEWSGKHNVGDRSMATFGIENFDDFLEVCGLNDFKENQIMVRLFEQQMNKEPIRSTPNPEIGGLANNVAILPSLSPSPLLSPTISKHKQKK